MRRRQAVTYRPVSVWWLRIVLAWIVLALILGTGYVLHVAGKW